MTSFLKTYIVDKEYDKDVYVMFVILCIIRFGLIKFSVKKVSCVACVTELYWKSGTRNYKNGFVLFLLHGNLITKFRMQLQTCNVRRLLCEK